MEFTITIVEPEVVMFRLNAPLTAKDRRFAMLVTHQGRTVRRVVAHGLRRALGIGRSEPASDYCVAISAPVGSTGLPIENHDPSGIKGRPRQAGARGYQ